MKTTISLKSFKSVYEVKTQNNFKQTPMNIRNNTEKNYGSQFRGWNKNYHYCYY